MRVPRPLRLVLLSATLSALAACGPQRGGGGRSDDDDAADDDDATDDDDDAADDDDEAPPEDGWVSLSSQATGDLELPAIAMIIRSPVLGMSFSLVAGDRMSCAAYRTYTSVLEPAYAAWREGDLSADAYVETVGEAFQSAFGVGGWTLSLAFEARIDDPGAPLQITEGAWPAPFIALLGPVADPLGTTVVSEGIRSAPTAWEGELEEAGIELIGSFALVGTWEGGELDGESIAVTGDAVAPYCVYDSRGAD